MIVSTNYQLILLLIYFLCGLFFGFLFDLFRLVRTYKTSSYVSTYIEDIFYCLIVSIIMFFVILFLHGGTIRLYSFLSSFAGLFFYLIIISKFVLKLLKIISSCIYKIFRCVLKILLFPIKIIVLLLKKPFILVFNFGKRKTIFIKDKFGYNYKIVKKFIFRNKF